MASSHNRLSSPDRFAIEIRASRDGLPVSYIRSYIRAAHVLIRSPLHELSIALVDSRQMARLHHQYLRQKSPTDVLTFELDHDRRGRPTSGEIVICTPIARRQAQKLNHPFRRELLLYALHGLLHLSGWDDRTPSAFAAMHAKEDEILSKLGVGNTFDSARGLRQKAGAR